MKSSQDKEGLPLFTFLKSVESYRNILKMFSLYLSYVLSKIVSPITYYWTVPLILEHSYLVGKSTSSNIIDTKVSVF